MRHILLIISGSIAAYKGLELIRRGRERDYRFTPVLTAGAQQFITPLAAASLAEAHCYTDLFSLKDETEMGHIRLSREADAILIAPASADLLAKMAQGRCDDLASTVLLATDKPVFAAPGMNHKMWAHAAMQRNLQQLIRDGVTIIQPEAGALACGEVGTGRMAEVMTILDFMDGYFKNVPSPVYGGGLGRGENDASSSPLPSSPRKRGEGDAPLAGKHALVTAGPTREPLDPVRFLSNHSSGKQGYAIAEALAQAGARVTLVSGPTALPCPAGVSRIDTITAHDMLQACEQALPADIAVCAAAVSDWRSTHEETAKIKKMPSPSGQAGMTLSLTETPDILATLAAHAQRPGLLIGFAAETENLLAHARDKRMRKGCDWMLANDVSHGVFGEEENQVSIITAEGEEALPRQSKQVVAQTLVQRIVAAVPAS